MESPKKIRMERLTPDSEMLNTKFDGYKLCVDPILVESMQLHEPVRRSVASNAQLSYQHTLMFAYHNALFYDKWFKYHFIYYVSKDFNIHCINWDDEDNTWCAHKVEYAPSEPTPLTRANLCVNPSMSFASNSVVLMSDGRGVLSVFCTCHRGENHRWNLMATLRPRGVDESAFVIVDSKVCDEDELHCILQCIDNKKSSQCYSNLHSNTVILWMTYKRFDSDWVLERKRKFVSEYGTVHYAAFNADASAICVVASKPLRFCYDTSKAPGSSICASATQTESEDVLPDYVWSQNDREVFILIPHMLTKKIKEENVAIDILNQDIRVQIIDHRIIFDDELMCPIVPAKSSWFLLDSGRLKLVLVKKKQGEHWTSLADSNKNGKYLADPSSLEEECDRLENFKLSENAAPKQCFNVDQLEECDDTESFKNVVMWIDGNRNIILHEANAHGCPFLFSVTPSARQMPQFCLRHNVDGILWRPDANVKCLTHFSHQATFDAFGFVQAANPSRKFVTCSPDNAFAVMAELNSRVYIYWQRKACPKVCCSKEAANKSPEQIIMLDGKEEIVGLSVRPNVIFILTEHHIYAALIDREERA